MALFWDKVDFSEYIPLVPTSAITGDGIGDLIALSVEKSSKNLASTLMLSMEVEAVVMEVSRMLLVCFYQSYVRCAVAFR